MTNHRRNTTALAALLLAAGALTSTACHYQGGPRYSADRFTYESSSWYPKTVSLIDTRTGQTVWTVDIPVGEQLVVGFSRGTGPNEFNTDEIVWGLMPAGQRFGTRDNRMPCPPSGVRRLDVALRPAPELPGDMAAGAAPREVRNVGGRVLRPVDPDEAPAPNEQKSRSPFLPPIR